MKHVHRRIYWQRKSDSKQLTMFEDTPLVKLNMRHNSSTERRMAMEAELILKEKGSWVDAYKDLMLAGWGWEKAAYIAWASTPKNLRMPKYLYEFSGMIRVHRRSIALWVKNDFAMNMVIRERMMAPLIDHQRDVVDALVESAENPSPRHFQDRRLFLEIAGIYVPGKALFEKMRRKEPGIFANLTDEELEELILESTHELGAGEEDRDTMTGW